MGDEVTLTKEISPINPNCTKNKSHGNNYNSNCNSDRVGGEEQELDNLKGFE